MAGAAVVLRSSLVRATTATATAGPSRKIIIPSSLAASSRSRRGYATTSSSIPARAHHRVVVVGGGTAGITVAAQLKRTPQLEKADIAIVDPAAEHHYQPGWTLVGSGLKPLGDFSRPLADVVPAGVQRYQLRVSAFDPENNAVRTAEGVDLSYDFLVVAPGLETNFAGVKGLESALADPASQVSSIYSNRTVEQVWRNIQNFKKGKAIFTQPAGVIKCAGGPQKILWMALSQWARDGVRGDIDATFATGAGGTFPSLSFRLLLRSLRYGVQAPSVVVVVKIVVVAN